MSKNGNNDLFFSYSRDFLFLYLRQQELKSDNTITAYRQGLNSFRIFMKSEYGKGISKITFEIITAGVVREYLKWLVDSKKVTPSTRNHRLTSIKQYLTYCTERNIELAQYLIPIAKIKQLTVRPKKGIWMSRDAVKAIIDQPPKTKLGIRDRFFMIFLYGTGARVRL